MKPSTIIVVSCCDETDDLESEDTNFRVPETIDASRILALIGIPPISLSNFFELFFEFLVTGLFPLFLEYFFSMETKIPIMTKKKISL